MRRIARLGRTEWPTLAVAAAVHIGWLAVVVAHRHLPVAVSVALLAVFGAWHTSLQHEVIHGHPFRSRLACRLLASVPITLWVPYGDYRDSHLVHHRDEHLTDPVDDPESSYVTPERWATAGRGRRIWWHIDRTLAGRTLLGPVPLTIRYWVRLARATRRDGRTRLYVFEHAVSSAALLGFVVGVAGMPWWLYAIGAGYLARTLALVRSFAEHRWVPGDASRSAVVRAGRFWSLLFLNNNLHHTHHARPGAPWYRLPLLADALGSDDAAAAGAGFYAGYGDVARRYLVRPLDVPVHPAMATAAA